MHRTDRCSSPFHCFHLFTSAVLARSSSSARFSSFLLLLLHHHHQKETLLAYPLSPDGRFSGIVRLSHRRPSIPTSSTRFFHYSPPPCRAFTPLRFVCLERVLARSPWIRTFSLDCIWRRSLCGMRYLAAKVTRILRSLLVIFLSSLSLSLSLCARLFPCRISSLVAPNLSFLLVLFVTFFLYFFCNKSIRVTLTGE